MGSSLKSIQGQSRVATRVSKNSTRSWEKRQDGPLGFFQSLVSVPSWGEREICLFHAVHAEGPREPSGLGESGSSSLYHGTSLGRCGWGSALGGALIKSSQALGSTPGGPVTPSLHVSFCIIHLPKGEEDAVKDRGVPQQGHSLYEWASAASLPPRLALSPLLRR